MRLQGTTKIAATLLIAMASRIREQKQRIKNLKLRRLLVSPFLWFTSHLLSVVWRMQLGQGTSTMLQSPKQCRQHTSQQVEAVTGLCERLATVHLWTYCQPASALKHVLQVLFAGHSFGAPLTMISDEESFFESGHIHEPLRINLLKSNYMSSSSKTVRIASSGTA